MPKRKRSDDDGKSKTKTKEKDISIEQLLTKLRDEIHRALKTAKGFERQRQSKRLRDAKSTPDKKARILKEGVVLKSLDLQQTAHAHLCSTLLRINRIAESPRLPADIKEGAAKPDLTEEERSALHNVTSALYCREEVRAATNKAIAGVCNALGIPVPEKKGKGGKKRREDDDVKEKVADKEELEPQTVLASVEKDVSSSKRSSKEKAAAAKGKAADVEEDDDEEMESVDEDVELRALSRFEDMLGSSDDEEERAAGALVKALKRKKREAPPPAKELDPMEITDDEIGEDDDGTEGDDESEMDLDPMAITSDEEEEGDGSDDGDEDADSFGGFSSDDDDGASNDEDAMPQHKKKKRPVSEDDSDSESDSGSSLASESLAPPPRKKLAPALKKKSTSARSAEAASAAESSDSRFLPTLMGGYISGSESASDLDEVAPRKNRRGQRARQAIWEKKFKQEAKHIKNGTGKAARDAGWDMKRGAVEGEAGKPWKRGIRNPLGEAAAGGTGEVAAPPVVRIPKPKTRDDAGTLHPSWEARKKLKALERETAPYEGKKITFDD
ncbi:Bud-site selection protein [Bombardia bombarda]|uniref:Bud-site selection protein n=1 Tax=Bombardia bombarda TaxID=252184 RepID=A0AA39X8J7_9PEZI|nr:Bud-site selection protein [Bombardia bombarda]